MNVLIVGSGKGSFTMRGLQVGAALGARVTSQPTEHDWAWADCVVLVKRAAALYAHDAHRHGLPIIWDALDFWRQPAENGLTEAEAMRRLRAEVDRIQPTVTVGATEAMAAACGCVCIPHHAWSGLNPTEARETIQTVAYEGNPVYLGRWQTLLHQACAARGWRFVVNPPDLSEADLLVAFRDGQWDGWMCREWKSGVKVVNAIAAGRPLLSQPSAAFRELQPVGSIVQTFGDLSDALDRWTPLDVRADAVIESRARYAQFGIAVIADKYRAVLERKEQPCCSA